MPSSETPGARLEHILKQGLSEDPLEHAEQVAAIAGVLYDAFGDRGMECILAGGSAIEVHAPGIHRSGDLDVVIDELVGVRDRAAEVFRDLGFAARGRHWVRGDLFLELLPGPVSGPTELVRMADATFRVVSKEVLLRDRIVGFKHWKETSYGAQAIEMLAAFGEDLDMEWLTPQLVREGSLDAFRALEALLHDGEEIDQTVLRGVLEELRSGGGPLRP